MSDPYVRLDVWGTVVFGLACVVAVVLDGAARTGAAVVFGVLFAGGTVLTGAAIVRAIGRSRYEVISVNDLFLLTAAPRDVRRTMQWALAVQVVGGFVAAGIRPFTAVAFAVLVPMWGVGWNGWWSAVRGEFPARDDGPAGGATNDRG